MRVPSNSPAATAYIFGYFFFKSVLIVTGAVMAHLNSSWWALLILVAFLF